MIFVVTIINKVSNIVRTKIIGRNALLGIQTPRPPITQVGRGSRGTWATGPKDTEAAVYVLQNDNSTKIDSLRNQAFG